MRNDGSRYGYIIVLCAFIIMSVQWSVIYSFGVFLKPLLTEFGWSRAGVAGAFSLSSLIGGVVVVYMGWLNDRIGPRLVMSLCGILLGSGCLLVSQTQSLSYFYLTFGVIIGIAMGGQFTPLMSTVARWFSARRGTMSGIVAAGVGVGALIGPQISNQLVLHLGWRVAFAILGIAVMVLMVACAQFLRRAPTPTTLDGGGDWGSRPPGQAAHAPVTHGQAMRSAAYWLLMLTGFCYGYTLFSLTVHAVAHALDHGLSNTLAVGVLTTFGGLSVLGKLLFGRLSDHFGSKYTMLLGFSIVLLAYIGLIVAQQAWAIYACVAIFGFFYGSITVSQSPLTAVLFGLKSHGLILGVFATSVTIGGALGPYLTGYLYDHSGSYRAAFMVGACIAFLGMIATAKIKQQRLAVW